MGDLGIYLQAPHAKSPVDVWQPAAKVRRHAKTSKVPCGLGVTIREYRRYYRVALIGDSQRQDPFAFSVIQGMSYGSSW